jgi:hypothetical protein
MLHHAIDGEAARRHAKPINVSGATLRRRIT